LLPGEFSLDIQRIRTLTTGRLHTKIEHIYEDIEFFTQAPGIMTHHIPAAMRALQPALRNRFYGAHRIWHGGYDPNHVGDFDVEPLNEEEIAEFWTLFKAELTKYW